MEPLPFRKLHWPRHLLASRYARRSALATNLLLHWESVPALCRAVQRKTALINRQWATFESGTNRRYGMEDARDSEIHRVS